MENNLNPQTTKWTVTLPNGKTQAFERDGDKIHICDTSMVYTIPVFAEGLAKMRAAGAKIEEK